MTIPVGQPTTVAKDGFTANTDTMYLSAATWTDVSTALLAAADAISEGYGHKWDFGLLSNAAQLGNMHDAFVEKIGSACATGSKVATVISGDLDATAKAYDEADKRAAANAKGAHA